MSMSALEFVRILAEHRLLDASQLEDLGPFVPQYRDAAGLAKQLIDWNWLTDFQLEAILQGQARSLLFGDYRKLSLLGQGGMGEVYKAAHVRLNRHVALKVIRPQSLKNTENPKDLIRRFQREAQAASQLLHPNIVILFDCNEIDGTHFIAMEYVDGHDMMKIVQDRGGAVPVTTACDYIRQAALGLQQVFEYGMVHRDIKPSNLLVTKPTPAGVRTVRGPNARSSGQIPRPGVPIPRGNPGGVVKILDLGLVRMTDTIDDHSTLTALTMQGAVIGTPDFISPEQARDATKVDIRSDLYSLGCTFYYLLTGRAPFPNGSSVEKLLAHQNEMPTALDTIRPGLPAEVVGIVQRLMSKRAESRFQTPADLVDAISGIPHEVLTGQGRVSAAPMPAYTAPESPLPSAAPPPTQFFSPDSLILPAKKAASLTGHRGYVTALAFGPDGRLLATGGIDGTVRLWDVGLARPVERQVASNDGLGEVHHLCFGPTGKVLYAGSSAIHGHNWRWEWTGPQQTVRSRFENDQYRTSCFAISPDGHTIAAGSAAAVLLYDANGRKPTQLKGHSHEVRALCYSPNGKRLYSAGADRRIIMWEPSRFWNTQRATFDGHKDTVTSLCLIPDGTVLASGSADGSICLWDAGAESTDALATLSGHSAGVRLVRFLAPGNLLLSVADGGQVFLWDVAEQVKIREWQIEKGLIHSVAISPDARFLAVGQGDGQVSFYDLELMGAANTPTAKMAGV
ncbi:MAG: serine/threonine protein kinase [Gemmataceae bacterium]|nr:serine/threonine protein kinase [Gemmataceae bacterium]